MSNWVRFPSLSLKVSPSLKLKGLLPGGSRWLPVFIQLLVVREKADLWNRQAVFSLIHNISFKQVWLDGETREQWAELQSGCWDLIRASSHIHSHR